MLDKCSTTELEGGSLCGRTGRRKAGMVNPAALGDGVGDE